VEAERLVVGENFNPEIGFVRREDFEQSFAKLRFSPRPLLLESVRKFSFEGSFDYVNGGDGQLETRQLGFEFRTEFENGDRIFTWYNRNFEFLDEVFDITDDVLIPIGGYNFQRYGGGYSA
jgi:hypothetical protein